MLFIEFDRSGVRGRESCAKSKVVSLEVANDFCFCIVVNKLKLASEVGVVDHNKMSIRSSLAEICCMISKKSFNFRLKIEPWE